MTSRLGKPNPRPPWAVSHQPSFRHLLHLKAGPLEITDQGEPELTLLDCALIPCRLLRESRLAGLGQGERAWHHGRTQTCFPSMEWSPVPSCVHQLNPTSHEPITQNPPALGDTEVQ